MALQKNPLLTEKTVDLIVKQIEDNFNSYCADIDSRHTDGIGLERLESESVYISNKYEALRLPAVFVLFENHAFQYTKDPNYMESEDTCVVVVSSEDVGADVLTRKMWRYGRVLYACLNLIDLDADDRIKIKLVPTRLGYTQPITDKLKEKGRKYRMDAVVELKILHYEKFLI